MRFCAFRVPDMENMEDIIKCLDAHQEDLREPCKDMVANATATISKFHTACDEDLNKICPAAVGNSDKTHECVVENLAELSSGCLQAISDIAKDMKNRHPGPHGPPHPFSMGPPFSEFGEMGAATIHEEMEHLYQPERNSDEAGPPRGKAVFAAMFAGGVGAMLTVGVLFAIKKIMLKRKLHGPLQQPMDSPLLQGACLHGAEKA